jgi:hypothetical protein
MRARERCVRPATAVSIKSCLGPRGPRASPFAARPCHMSAAELEQARRLAERTRKKRRLKDRAEAQSDDLLAAAAGRSLQRSEQLAADTLDRRHSAGVSHRTSNSAPGPAVPGGQPPGANPIFCTAEAAPSRESQSECGAPGQLPPPAVHTGGHWSILRVRPAPARLEQPWAGARRQLAGLLSCAASPLSRGIVPWETDARHVCLPRCRRATRCNSPWAQSGAARGRCPNGPHGILFGWGWRTACIPGDCTCSRHLTTFCVR